MTEGAEKDIAKDGLLAIAPRDTSGRPTLGGIPLYKKLGQGGMGAVYLGKHPRLGVEVAVKILPFHLADQDPNAIEYFMREANVAARLNHPSLVRIFDVNVDGDPKAGSAIWYLVMEFVSGQTAGRLIKDRIKGGRGPLPEADALDILLTVSDGLAAAHEQKFIHRDIKPDNIIIPVGPDGEPGFRKAKLMDLGLAKVHSEELSMGPTGTNVAMGTPGYMAPEQAENAKGAGPPADVFAMGATLYSLLTGSAPFTGTTVLNVLKKTSDEAHTSIRKVNPAVSRPTEVLIDTCLAKRPEMRYGSAGILREALKACRQTVAGESPPDVTLASLQNLASLAANEATVKVGSSSMAPSVAPRTSPTALSPEAPTKTAPATRFRRAPVLVACSVLLIGAAVGGYFVLKPGPAKHTPDTSSAEFDQLLRDAEAAFAEENYEKAATLYAAALQKNPTSGAAADGQSRSRRMREEDSDATKEVREAESLKKGGDAEGAWRRIRSGIENHPHSTTLRLWAGAFALEHDTYSWLNLAIADVQAALKSRTRRRPQAEQLLQKLTEKKKRIDEAGGVLPEIQAALDQEDWDGAEKLLDKVKPNEREGFATAIRRGRKWETAVEQGKQAEAAGRWSEALAAYRESQTFRVHSETDAAIQRIEKDIDRRYGIECERAEEKARAGGFKEAREHLDAAEQLKPRSSRHEKIREDVSFQEHLSEARKLKADGKNGESLAAARKALEIRRDSDEAKALVDQLQKEGPLSLAKAALASGDRVAAVRHAREAAAQGAATPDLKSLEAELWAELYVEKAAAPARGPVDELMIASEGRILGVGAGFGSFSVWEAGTLKPRVSAPAGGSKLHSPVLVERDDVRVAGLAAPPGPDGPEMQPVIVWEGGRVRPLQVDVSGLKLPVTATRLAPFDANVVLRIRWTPGDPRSGPDVYTLDFLDVDGATAREPIPARAQAHASVAVSPNRKHFATGGGIYRTWRREGNRDVVDERKGDPSVYLWNRDTLAKRAVDLGEPAGEGALLTFTPDGAKLFVATAAKKLFVIDVESARVDGSLSLPEIATSLSASTTQLAVVAGRRVHLVRLSDSKVAPATGLPSARSVAWSPAGDSLFVGGDDGVLRRYAREPLAK